MLADIATVEALKQITGAERVRVLLNHDEKGNAVYVEDAYVAGPNETFQFVDHSGQHRIVPLTRVEALLPKSEPKAEAKADAKPETKTPPAK